MLALLYAHNFTSSRKSSWKPAVTSFALCVKCKTGLSLGHWCWEAILLDSGIDAVPEPKKKKKACERLLPIHQSISFKHHPLRHCLAKTFSMRVAHCTACPHCIQFGAATNTVFYASHAVVRPHIRLTTHPNTHTHTGTSQAAECCTLSHIRICFQSQVKI